MRAFPQFIGPGNRLEVIKPILVTADRVVLQVWDTLTQQHLALKGVLAPLESALGHDILREVAHLRDWQHPALPLLGQVYVSVPLPGKALPLLAFTQEWLEGPSLSARLRECPSGLPVEDVKELARALLELLAWMEEGRLAGLDLKPDHLIHTATGWRVLDLEQVQPENPLRKCALAGTPRYAAPELLDELPADTRSDLYSVGRIFLEALTGALPKVSAESLPALAEALRRLPLPAPDWLQQLNHAAPGLAQLLPLLLAPSPADRPASAQDALGILLQDARAAARWRDQAPLPPVSRPVSSGIRPCPSAAGHEAAHEQLELTWQQLRLGSGCPGFRLDAPSGAGNSHFLQDVEVRLQVQGRPILRLVPDKSLVGPFAAAFRLLEFVRAQGFSTDSISPPSDAQPIMAESTTSGDSSQDWGTRALRLARQIAFYCRLSVESTPITLLIDGLAALDEPSQEVLAHLMPMLLDTRLLLVAVPPASESAPFDSVSRTLLKRFALLTPLPLSPLTMVQARALADARLPRYPLDASTLAALLEASQGWAGRFVRGLTALWQDPGRDPTQLFDLLTGKRAEGEPPQLPPDAASMLSLSAILQQVDDFCAEGQILRALHLLRRTWATHSGDNPIDDPAAAKLGLRLAELELSQGHAREALQCLDEHPKTAHDFSPRVQFLRARALKALGRYQDALQKLETQGAPEGGLNLEERLGLLHLQAWLYLVTRQPVRALEVLRQTRPLVNRQESRAGGQHLGLIQRSYEVWARMVALRPEDKGEMGALIDDLKGLILSARRLQYPLDEQRARVLLAELGQGQGLPEARAWLEEAAVQARQAFDLPAEASALNNLARFLAKQGKDSLSEAAQEALLRANAVYARLQDHTSQARVLLQLTGIYSAAERPASARQALGQAQALFQAGADSTLLPWYQLLDAQLRRREGMLDGLDAQLEQAHQALWASKQPALAFVAGVERLELLLETGQLEQALALGQGLATVIQPGLDSKVLHRFHSAMSRVHGPAEAPRLSAASSPAAGETGSVQAADLAWLDRMERLLAHTEDRTRLATALAEALAELLQGRAVVLLESPKGPVVAHTGLSLSQLEAVSKSVVERVLNEQKLWYCADLHASQEATGRSVRGKGYRSVACAPIVQGGRAVGVLYIDHPSVAGVTGERALEAIQKVARLTGSLLSSLDADLRQAEEDNIPLYGLLGNSPAMRRLRRDIHRLCQSQRPNLTVMLRGETGTGKSTIARILHSYGARAHKPLVVCDLRALTETLIETELFGYEKGAFSDAKEARMGRFEQAHEGTLFLDEAQNLTIALQEKLLVPLSDAQVTRMGGNRARPVDIRLIVAASRDLRTMRDEGRFLDALVNRLWLNPIVVPSLRERGPDDVRLLLEHRVRGSVGLSEQAPLSLERYIHRDALSFLSQYRWPGNVRELDNLFKAEVVCEQLMEIQQRAGRGPAPIPLSDLLDHLQLDQSAEVLTPGADDTIGSDGLPPSGHTLDWLEHEFLASLRRRYAQRELALQGTKTQTAKVLDVSRTTLDKML